MVEFEVYREQMLPVYFQLHFSGTKSALQLNLHGTRQHPRMDI